MAGGVPADFAELECEIRAEALPENGYGLKRFLLKGVYRDPFQGYYVKKDKEDTLGGYDCFESAVATQKALDKRGINSEVCEGIDALGIFKRHFFLRVEDEFHTIIDGTPLYSFVGAKHRPSRALMPEYVKLAMKVGVSSLEGEVPVSYRKNGEGEEFLSACGITGGGGGIYHKPEEPKSGIPKPLEISMFTLRIVEGKPVDSVRTIVRIPDRQKYISCGSHLSDGSRVYGPNERLEEMEKLGAIEVRQEECMTDFDVNGLLINIARESKHAARQTKEAHLENYDVLCHFVEEVPRADVRSAFTE